MNNCAQIHKEFHRYQKANKLFQSILSSLMVLRECEYGDGNNDGEDENAEIDDHQQTKSKKQTTDDEEKNDLDGFYATTLHFIFKYPTMSYASAA